MELTAGKILLYTSSFFSLYTAIFLFLSYFERIAGLKNPILKKFPFVSIMVPAYNEQATIGKTIQSLLNLDYPRNKLQIIIVNDGSKDATRAIAESFMSKGVEVINKRNSGKGDSLNMALKKAKGEFVVSMDADSFVNPDCLKKMLGYFSNPSVMAVTPSLKVYNPNGILQRLQAIEYLIGVYLRKVFAYLGSIHVVPGPFSMFRKSFFDTYGGYDADNLTEDIEIAFRIQSNKFIIENSIDANVYTIGPNTFKDLLKQRLRWYVGFLNNIQNYKHLFGRQYGNLGLFFLPGVFISTSLVIALTGYLLFRTIARTYDAMLDLWAIHFDIWPLLNFKFDPFFINLDSLFILGILSLCIAITIIWIAKRDSKEPSKLSWNFAIYLVFYLFIYAFWWLLSGIYKAFNIPLGWGKKT